MIPKETKVFALCALFLVQILFGINFVTSKMVVSYLQPTTFASLRFLIAGVFLYLYTIISSKQLHPKPLTRSTWFYIIGLSTLGIALSQSLFLWGLKHSTSTNTAILSTSIPIFTLIIVSLRGQSKLSWREITGFFVALIGLFIFHDVRSIEIGSVTLWGDLSILCSCILMATYISFCKDLFQRIPLFWGTTLLFLVGGATLLPFALQDLSQLQSSPPPMFYAGFIFSVFGATLTTYFINNWAYQHVSPAIISLFIYLQPVAAAVAAYEIMDETLIDRKIYAAILIFIGMIISTSQNLKTSLTSNHLK